MEDYQRFEKVWRSSALGLGIAEQSWVMAQDEPYQKLGIILIMELSESALCSPQKSSLQNTSCQAHWVDDAEEDNADRR